MAATVLLLGHGKKSGLDVAGLLAALGYRPVAATWRAFSPARRAVERPDLLLADMDQPAAWPMSKLSHAVRQAWGETFPIAALTAAKSFQAVAALLDEGANAVLPKNPPIDLLEKKLGRCLRENTPPALDELTEEIPESLLGLFCDNSRLVRLGDLANVYAGATPRRPGYRRMAPPDEGWRGVLTSDVVGRFYVGRPTAYLSWNRLHLFRLPPPHEYSVPEKVLLLRAGPPLAAAVDRSRLPAGTDVYSLVPAEGVTAGYLACLLNSRLLDFYCNRLAGIAADGRLRPEVIREIPVPPPDRAVAHDLARAASLLAHYGPNPESWYDRQARDEMRDSMEEMIFSLYGADREVRAGLETLHF